MKVRSVESVPFSRYSPFYNVLHICNVRAIPTYGVLPTPWWLWNWTCVCAWQLISVHEPQQEHCLPGQIYSIPATHSLHVKCLCVRQQHGTLDCGVFSIAYAVERCFGHNPEKAHYKKLMRRYLSECFSKHRLTPFPESQSEELLPRPTQNTFTVKLYCTCKMPARCLSCNLCGQWYHCSCMQIESENVPDYWECPKWRALWHLIVELSIYDLLVHPETAVFGRSNISNISDLCVQMGCWGIHFWYASTSCVALAMTWIWCTMSNSSDNR